MLTWAIGPDQQQRPRNVLQLADSLTRPAVREPRAPAGRAQRRLDGMFGEPPHDNLNPMVPIKHLLRGIAFVHALTACLLTTAVGQCLDTNALLDSTYSINVNTLNELGLQRNYDDVSAGLDSAMRLNHLNPGDVYQQLILSKIFRQKGLPASKADSLFRLLKPTYDNAFVTRIRYTALQSDFFLALVTNHYRDMYLVTLSKTLDLIDFVPFHRIDDVRLVPRQTDPAVYEKQEAGISSSCDQRGTVEQVTWTRTSHGGTEAEPQSSAHVRRLRMENSGLFRPSND